MYTSLARRYWELGTCLPAGRSLNEIGLEKWIIPASDGNPNSVKLVANNQLINGCRQLPVAVGDGVAGIVRVQPHLHCIPGVLPGRMVVLLLGQYGHTRHKGECFAEVLKGKLAV